MDHTALHDRTRRNGSNGFVYWPVRFSFQTFFHLYFGLKRTGLKQIPKTGAVIIASNHRSFLDPFIIGTLARRPMHYVAKREIFANPVVAWFLSSLGAFPVARGQGDTEMIRTAKDLLSRGEIVLIFPEGTRTRPGPLGRARRGVGRLALETGAPVVPIAVIGTEAVRKGWRIRPHRVRVKIGEPVTFPKVEEASPELARSVTEQIWERVKLEWDWLGGASQADGEGAAMQPSAPDRLCGTEGDLESVGGSISAS